MNLLRQLYKTSYKDFDYNEVTVVYISPKDIDDEGVGEWYVFAKKNKQFDGTYIVNIFIGLDGNYTDDYGNFSNFDTNVNINIKKEIVKTAFEKNIIDSR